MAGCQNVQKHTHKQKTKQKIIILKTKNKKQQQLQPTFLNSPGYGTQFECTTTKNQQTTQNQNKKQRLFTALVCSNLKTTPVYRKILASFSAPSLARAHCDFVSTSSVQFSSRWYLCARKSPYALHPSLRSFPNVAFETVPMLILLTVALSRPFKEDRLALPVFQRLNPPGDRWYDVLGFVPAGSVSNFSTLQIFRRSK